MPTSLSQGCGCLTYLGHPSSSDVRYIFTLHTCNKAVGGLHTRGSNKCGKQRLAVQPYTPHILRLTSPSSAPFGSPSLAAKKINSSHQMAAASIANPALAESEPDLSPASLGIVNEELALQLVYDALTWCSLNGLIVGDRNVENSGTIPGFGIVHAPVALFPTPFSAQLFNRAASLATIFNDLADAVSQDSTFLQDTLRRAGKTDTFTAGLLDIHTRILDEGISQNIRLGMHRSDYMLDMATGGILQVELNTISSSFPGLGSLVSSMHRFLVDRTEGQAGLDVSRVPENLAADNMAEALALAWQEYGDRTAAVLMVVHDPERNMYDQHWLTAKLWSLHRVPLIRKTFAQIHSEGRLAEDGSLYIGKQLVSVVYYRAGYGPDDYPTDTEWQTRLLLERSRAIKCPTVAYHLAGAKKIQQELARPGVLERFVPTQEDAAALRECFAGLWGLEGEHGAEAIQSAIADPERFVLKPQREGGGNNIYGSDVREKLVELQDKDGGEGLAAYILMQRIFPPIHSSYLLRGGRWSREDTLSELGIYGTYLRNGDRVILNKQAGHLLRTKTASSDEGGVAAGFGVLDSPYLT